ncbi:MAG: alpha/beta hydrolase [Clostridia bacterium]|nr:alpha/beta hydrolase [Clostridia bacterium]
MNKRISVLVTLVLLLLLPVQSIAQKTDDSVPVWTEENVRQYLQGYINGEELEKLYGYYDLQIRRYMPETTFACMLTELEWLTGGFQQLGSYRCFEEPERGTMTHIIHLHMEKQDLEACFTHKTAADDREVMALEFILAAESAPEPDAATDVPANARNWRETDACVGAETAYPLDTVITFPVEENGNRLIAGCVFVHDAGALDKNATVGETRFFESLARKLSLMGIASIRYDKRTYAYAYFRPATVQEEVVEDALLAAELLSQQPEMSGKPIYLIGHGFGATVLPRIAQDGSFAGMILIGSSTKPYVDQLLENALAAGTDDTAALKESVAALPKLTEQEAQQTELFGHSACYLLDLEQYDPIRMIKQLSLPTYIVQGREDASVTEEEGWKAYQEALKEQRFVSYNCYRGLNHVLARDLSLNADGKPEYAIDAGIESTAVRDLAQWIGKNLPQAETMEVE